MFQEYWWYKIKNSVYLYVNVQKFQKSAEDFSNPSSHLYLY